MTFLVLVDQHVGAITGFAYACLVAWLLGRTVNALATAFIADTTHRR